MLVAIQNRRGTPIAVGGITVYSYTGSAGTRFGGAAVTAFVPLVVIPPVIKLYQGAGGLQWRGAANTAVITVIVPVTTRTYQPTGQLRLAGTAPHVLFQAPSGGRHARIGRRGRSAPFPTYALLITKNGTGTGVITSSPGAINCGLACGGTFPQGTVLQLTPTPDAGSAFTQWGGTLAGATIVGTQLTLVMDQARTLTAAFDVIQLTHRLSVSVTGPGFGTLATTPPGVLVGPANGTAFFDFPTGALVTLTATPQPGMRFDGFAGACAGLTCSVFMDQDRTVSGSFSIVQAITWTLGVSKTGSGVGQITSQPAGLDCGLTCTSTFSDQTLVTLTAVVTPGNSFVNWSGAVNSTSNPVSLLMNANKQVTATFTLTLSTFPLTILKAGTGTGLVTSQPAAISCGGTCVVNFASGTVLLLTAAPDPGNSFVGWSGGVTSTTNPLTVTITGPLTLTATFAAALPPPPTILATLAVYERAGLTRTADPVEVVVPLSETEAVVDVAALDVRNAGDPLPAQFRVLSRYGDVGDSTASIRLAQGCFLPAVAAGAIAVGQFQVTNGGAHPTVGGLVYTQDATAHHITTGFGNGALDCTILKVGGHNLFDTLFVRQAGAWLPVCATGNLSTYYLHGLAAQSQDLDYNSRDYTGTPNYTTSVEWVGTERLVLLVQTRLGVAGAEFMGSGAEARLAVFSPLLVPGPVAIEARYTFTKDSGLVELDVLWKGHNGDWTHPQDAYFRSGGLRLVPTFGGAGAPLAAFDESNSVTKAMTVTHATGNTNVLYYDYAPAGTSYNFSRPSTNWGVAGATTDAVLGTEGWYGLGDVAGTRWVALMHKDWKANVPHGFRYDGTTLEATLWPPERGHVPSGPPYHILGGTHYYRWRGAVAVGAGPLVTDTLRTLYQRRLGTPLVAHAQAKWETSGALSGIAAPPVGFVLGTDGHRYRATVTHTATLATQPITGASFATVWTQDDGNLPAAAARPWVAGRRYGTLFYGTQDRNEALTRRARWALAFTDPTASTDGKTLQTTYTSRNAGVYTYYGWNRYGCWIGDAPNGASCGCNRDELIESLAAAWLAYGEPVLLEWADRLATHMGGFASWKGAGGITGTLQFGSLAPGLAGDTTLHLPEPDFVDDRHGMAYRPLLYLLTGYQPYRDLANLALATQYGKALDGESFPSQPHRSPVTTLNQTSLTGLPGGNQAVGGTRLLAGALAFFGTTFLMQGDQGSLRAARNLMIQGLVFTHRTVVGLEGPPVNTSGALTAEGGLGTIPIGVHENDGVQRALYAALPAPAIRLITQVAAWASLRPAYASVVSAADVTAMQLLVTQYAKYHLTGATGQARNLGDLTLGRPLVRGGAKVGSTVTLMGSPASWVINAPGADGSLLRADANGVINLGSPVVIQDPWANLLDLLSYAATLYATQGQAALAAYAAQAARDLFENLYLYASYPTATTWAVPIPITDRGHIVTGAETP